MKPPQIRSVTAAGPARVHVLTEDETLRRAGFKIHARPKNSGAIWSRGGHLYTHLEALRVAAREATTKDPT